MAIAPKDSNDPHCVMMGFAEALSAPEVAFSLQQAGYQVLAFTRRGARPALRKCRGVNVVEITAPEESAEAAERDLLQVLAARRPGVLLPTDDPSLWLCSQLSGRTPIHLAAADPSAVAVALDKNRQIEMAAAAGLAVPPTNYVAPHEAVADLPMCPMVLKPSLAVFLRDGKLRRPGGWVCADAEELARALAGRDASIPLLLQPYIVGVGEGLFGFATAQGVCAWSAHRRVRMMNPQGSGSSACTSITPDTDLLPAVERFVRAVGWRGMFMIELLRDTHGKAWFMELNGRAWGSMALARRAGFEYPAWTVAQATDSSYTPIAPSSQDPLTCRHLGRELVHLMMVMRGPKSRALVKWPSRWQALRDVMVVRRSDRWYNHREGGLRLLVADTLQTILAQIRKRGTL